MEQRWRKWGRNVRLLGSGLLLLLVCSCSTGRPANGDLTGVRPDALLSTLSANVEISYRNGDKSGTVRGLMIYRRPDRFRVVLLSPFGSTLMEAALTGDEVTLLYPAQQAAFRGTISQLPLKAGLDAWKLLPWVFELQQPVEGAVSGSASAVRRQSQGHEETVVYDGGLIAEKRRDNGERVRYAGYRNVEGVALAMAYEIATADGAWVRLRLDEPGVNGELAEQAFSVVLRGVRVFPLSLLKEEE